MRDMTTECPVASPACPPALAMAAELMEVEGEEKEAGKEGVKEAVKEVVAGKEEVKEGVKLLNGAKPKDSDDSELPHDSNGDAVENGEIGETNGSEVVTDNKCNGDVASEDAEEKGCNGVEKEEDTKDAGSVNDVKGQTENDPMDIFEDTSNATQEGKVEVTGDSLEAKTTEDAPEKILEEANENGSDIKAVEDEEQTEDSLKILEEVTDSVNVEEIEPTEANIKPTEEEVEPTEVVEFVEESSSSPAVLGEASEEPANTEETAPFEAETASLEAETAVLEAEAAPKEAETNNPSESDEKEVSEKDTVTDAEDEGGKATDSSTENTKKFIAGLQNLLESSAEDSDSKMEENVDSIVIPEKRVVSPFVDESIKEGDESMEDGEDHDNAAEVEPNKPEEKAEEVPASGSIELETAEASEEEELDVDRSLEACLDDLEKNIDEESEEAPVATRDTSEAVKEKVVESMENSVDNSATGNSSDADDEGGDSRMSTGNTSETEEPNAEEALASLAQIEKNTKRILDEDWTDEAESGKKRATDESGTAEPAVKKPKLDGDATEETAAMRKKIKKSLRKMKRSDIEDMIATKCIELLTNKSEVGKLRQQVDGYQETVERWKRRAGALSKQCTDLSTVMRKYITDTKTRGRDKVAPVRITRSVGLQVMTPDQRRLQQQRLSASRLTTRPAASPQPRAVAPGAPARTAQNSPRPAPSVGGLLPGSVTITPSKQSSSPSPAKKPSIAVVDLSDDESPAPKPRSAPALTQRPPPLRGATQQLGRPRGSSFRGQGNHLFSTRGRGGALNPRLGRPVVTAKSHPAPLPPMPNPQPNSPSWKLLPPRPALKISRVANGIVLSWNMNLNLSSHAGISSYQLYAYQETSLQRPDPSLWKKVGDVKALPLPMACTLTQFMRGNKYHFAVRAMDTHSRVGQFSEPNSILLN